MIERTIQSVLNLRTHGRGTLYELGADQRGAVAFEYLVLLLIMGIGVGIAFVDSTFKFDAGNALRGIGERTLGK